MSRKISFVVAQTDHGTMIVNRNDYNVDSSGLPSYGVGHEVLENGSFSIEDVDLLKRTLSAQRQLRGDGVLALDVGANIGVHTLEWARHMKNWGQVISIEPQKEIFYALSGNVIINNNFNVTTHNVAISNYNGTIKIPAIDYTRPGSFGSLELIKKEDTEYIGQDLDYQNGQHVPVRTIDSFNLDRLDLLKIDVEGMEIEALMGALNTIQKHRPVIFVEHIKISQDTLYKIFANIGYFFAVFGINTIAFHKDDTVIDLLR